MQEDKLRELVDELGGIGRAALTRITHALPGGFSNAVVRKNIARLGLSLGAVTGQLRDKLGMSSDDDADIADGAPASQAPPGRRASSGGAGSAARPSDNDNDSDAAGGSKVSTRPQHERAARRKTAGSRKRARHGTAKATALMSALEDSDEEARAAPSAGTLEDSDDGAPPRTRVALEDSDDGAPARNAPSASQAALQDSDDDFGAAKPPAAKAKAVPKRKAAPRPRAAASRDEPPPGIMQEQVAQALVSLAAELGGVDAESVAVMVEDMLAGMTDVSDDAFEPPILVRPYP